VKKKDSVLIFNNLGGFETRNPSTMWCIQKANQKYNWKDFDDIVIRTGDYECNDQEYTFSKQASYHRLVPDFNFHAWPQVGIDDYEEVVKEIQHAGLDSYKINKVGWIGNIHTHPRRKDLLDLANLHKDLFDVFDMKWMNSPTIVLNSTKFLSLPELVKSYSMLIDIEGNGYSGRLKYLLWSRRPLLLVDRPHKEFFFEHLKEWEHYIPVKRDLSDLVEKTKWCVDHEAESNRIAENAFQFSTIHLTREACYDKWNTIVTNRISEMQGE